jgi:hypothetical protein
MGLSRLGFGHPHQPLEEEERPGGCVTEALAAVGEPTAAVGSEEILCNLVD